MQNGLEIYAKVEDLLGVREVAPKLYNYYYNALQELSFDSLLDIGCGSGSFLAQLQKRFANKKFFGIDKSRIMVANAQRLGFNVSHKDLSQVTEKFDIATATFDMVNYLNKEEIKLFFNQLSNILCDGGYFLFDVNSEYGLSELAVGSFTAEDSDRFISIESFYEEGIYSSHFTFFEKEGVCYQKSMGIIQQYLYSEEFFRSLSTWKIKNVLPINLYDMGGYDKVFYILKKK